MFLRCSTFGASIGLVGDYPLRPTCALLVPHTFLLVRLLRGIGVGNCARHRVWHGWELGRGATQPIAKPAWYLLVTTPQDVLRCVEQQLSKREGTRGCGVAGSHLKPLWHTRHFLELFSHKTTWQRRPSGLTLSAQVLLEGRSNKSATSVEGPCSQASRSATAKPVDARPFLTTTHLSVSFPPAKRRTRTSWS